MTALETRSNESAKRPERIYGEKGEASADQLTMVE